MCCRHRAGYAPPDATSTYLHSLVLCNPRNSIELVPVSVTYWFFHDGVALACVDLLRPGGDQADTGSHSLGGVAHYIAMIPTLKLAAYIKVRNAPVLCVILDSGNSSPPSDRPPTGPTKRAWLVHIPKNLFENQHTPFR